jgi:hypothetical protein
MSARSGSIGGKKERNGAIAWRFLSRVRPSPDGQDGEVDAFVVVDFLVESTDGDETAQERVKLYNKLAFQSIMHTKTGGSAL